MIFNSLSYLLFLIVVVLLYWVLPGRTRLWLIFVSSLVFYSFWRAEFVPVILLSVLTGYIAALRIHETKDYKTRKLYLYIGIIVNTGLLFYFKYLLFFAGNAVSLLKFAGIDASPLTLDIILPLGISFYTFQIISYIVDVYRGFIVPEKDFLLYSGYITFFPQLVAGPVLRAAEVIPQLVRRAGFDLSHIGIGVRRILYGLFLKVVLADNIAPLVDSGFAQYPSTLSAVDVWTLAFLFGFQIYFDFSAYSHIALGSARLMGIVLPENFNFPYLAVSPRDFWRRWHISLSSWIRDYLYLPLTGASGRDLSEGGLETAASSPDTQKNSALFLTWAIMGLWHGAAWTFLLWGLYHAAFIFLYRLTAPAFQNIPAGARAAGGWAITLPVTMLGWVFFRIRSIDDALILYAKILQPAEYLSLGLRENYYLIAAMLLGGFLTIYSGKTFLAPVYRQNRLCSICLESATFGLIIGLVFVFLRPINQFIYFQF